MENTASADAPDTGRRTVSPRSPRMGLDRKRPRCVAVAVGEYQASPPCPDLAGRCPASAATQARDRDASSSKPADDPAAKDDEDPGLSRKAILTLAKIGAATLLTSGEVKECTRLVREQNRSMIDQARALVSEIQVLRRAVRLELQPPNMPSADESEDLIISSSMSVNDA